MSDIIKKKNISFSQFSTYWTCENKFYRDYILKKRIFDSSIILCFGTGCHDTIQLYLKTLFWKSEKQADKMDLMRYFKWAFKHELTKNKVKYTPEEWDEFVDDAQLILDEFVLPENRKRYFPVNKYELLGIETELKEEILNNLNVIGFFDLVLREKLTGDIKIIDFKTSTRGWTSEKEDFTKLAQLRLYKALYSKKYNIPLNKIKVEFFILKRKVYDTSKCSYPQTRLIPFIPTSYKSDIDETLHEFIGFVGECFTKEGEYITDRTYRKVPGDKKKNCKYCLYLKDGSCDGKADK